MAYLRRPRQTLAIDLTHAVIPKATNHLKSLTINGKLSPEHDPVLHPRVGKRPIDPVERRIDYLIHPHIAHAQEAVSASLNTVIKANIEGLSDIMPHMNSFLVDGKIDYPIVEYVETHSRRQAQVTFGTYIQAAQFSQLPDLNVTGVIGDGRELKIQLIRVGAVHDRNLTTMRLTPALHAGVNGDTISLNRYLHALTNFLDWNPTIKCIGAWQPTTTFDEGRCKSQPSVIATIVLPENITNHSLPGYINAEGIFEGMKGSFAYADDLTWFRLDYGHRRAFCKDCKTKIHTAEHCPSVECDYCFTTGQHLKGCPHWKACFPDFGSLIDDDLCNEDGE